MESPIADRLDAMRALVAVCEGGGFSAGARRLGLSPSAATRAVAGLERAIGVQLLLRSTRAVRLTPAGEAYLPLARDALDRAAAAEDAARAEGAVPTGRLRLAMPLVFGRLFAKGVVTDFMARHPDVAIELVVGNEQVRLVDAEVDLAIRIGHLPDSEMIVRGLGTTGVVLAAAPAYLRRAGPPVRPEDLPSHRLIAFAGVAPRRRWRFLDAGRAVDVRVEPALFSDNAEAAIAHAEAGLGIVSALRYQIGDQLRSGALVEVLPLFRSPPVPIQAVLPAARFVSPAIRELIEGFGAARSLWSD